MPTLPITRRVRQSEAHTLDLNDVDATYTHERPLLDWLVAHGLTAQYDPDGGGAAIFTFRTASDELIEANVFHAEEGVVVDYAIDGRWKTPEGQTVANMTLGEMDLGEGIEHVAVNECNPVLISLAAHML